MIASVVGAGLGDYVILYLAVAASWIGIPIVGASALAAAGVLASEGELNLELVILVATFAAWTGGYVGFWLGQRAGLVVTGHPGRWRRERRRAMATGERIYRRWGRLGVFLIPTWVSGALRMPRGMFLIWNALAALLSSCIVVLGAYGIGSAVVGQLSARRGTVALAISALTLIAVAFAVARRRSQADPPQGPVRSAPQPGADESSAEVPGQHDAATPKTDRGHG
jgi:membrane protein DedA with SNARE-associated domain